MDSHLFYSVPPFTFNNRNIIQFLFFWLAVFIIRLINNFLVIQFHLSIINCITRSFNSFYFIIIIIQIEPCCQPLWSFRISFSIYVRICGKKFILKLCITALHTWFSPTFLLTFFRVFLAISFYHLLFKLAKHQRFFNYGNIPPLLFESNCFHQTKYIFYISQVDQQN